MRIGHGYDAHRLGEVRKLVIGGVLIPYSLGMIAHSDGDVLVHAVIDALLGAAGERDIGSVFPDSDAAYKDISSLILLEKTALILKKRNLDIEYIDSTVIAEEPKMKPYIYEMRENMASALGISFEQINVKATTEEHMGFTGHGEGIAAHAVCILK